MSTLIDATMLFWMVVVPVVIVLNIWADWASDITITGGPAWEAVVSGLVVMYLCVMFMLWASSKILL